MYKSYKSDQWNYLWGLEIEKGFVKLLHRISVDIHESVDEI